MDDELQQVFNLMVSRGVNLFDSADSYGAPLKVTSKPAAAISICRGRFADANFPEHSVRSAMRCSKFAA